MSDGGQGPGWGRQALSGAVLVGVLSLGVIVGRNSHDGLVEYLRENNADLEVQAARLQSELTAVGRSLSGSRPADSEASFQGEPTAEDPVSTGMRTVTLRPGESASVDDSALRVSLVGISFGGSPLRHRAVVRLGGLGHGDLVLDQVDVGHSVEFGGYEVVVSSASSFSVSFWVYPSRE